MITPRDLDSIIQRIDESFSRIENKITKATNDIETCAERIICNNKRHVAEMASFLKNNQRRQGCCKALNQTQDK